jgi:hypothetical protein
MRLKKKILNPISVYSRKANDIFNYDIIPKCHLSDGSVIPTLNQIRDYDLNYRKDLILKIIGLNNAFLVKLEESLNENLFLDRKEIGFWSFVVIVINYWINNTRIIDYIPFMHSVIKSIIYYKFKDKYEMKNFNKFITDKSILNINLKILHNYAEFQSVLKLIVTINSIFEYPFGRIPIFQYLNGSLIYNLLMSDSHKRHFPNGNLVSSKKLCQMIS